MRAPILTAIVALVLASHSPALAASAKPSAVVGPPLSINPLDGQPLCLVPNQSPTATISVRTEIVILTSGDLARWATQHMTGAG